MKRKPTQNCSDRNTIISPLPSLLPMVSVLLSKLLCASYKTGFPIAKVFMGINGPWTSYMQKVDHHFSVLLESGALFKLLGLRVTLITNLLVQF